MIKIRPFIKGDAKKISQIIVQNLKIVNSQYYSDHIIDYIVQYYSPDQIKNISSTRQLFVATMSDKIVGVGGLEKEFIGTVFIDINYHGNGIGKRIMLFLEDLARSKGITKLYLNASLNAVQFYMRMAYIKESIQSDPHFGTTHLMYKQL